MKTLNKFKIGAVGVWISLFLAFSAFSTLKVNANPIVNIDFQVFYENLAPYGTWINDAQYGHVWAPDVDHNFRPYYTNGHWVNTEYGNMWVSNYSWGWAPFHYGRWTLNNRYGWVWVPGYEWGPSWVTWRQGGGYYGWAPMAPGISINVSFSSGYHVPNHYWTFVPYRKIYSTRLYSYHSVRRAPKIINNTTIINNTYINNDISYVTGPSRTDVRRTTGRDVKTYEVSRNNRSARTQVDGNRINLYQPETSRNATNTATRRSVQAEKTANPTTTTATRRSAATNRTSSSQPAEKSTSTTATRSSSNSVQRSKEPTSTNAATRRSTSVKENSPANTAPTATRKTTTSTPAATQQTRSTAAPAKTTNRKSTSTPTNTRSAAPSNSRATTSSSRSNVQKNTRATTNNRSSNTSASRRR